MSPSIKVVFFICFFTLLALSTVVLGQFDLSVGGGDSFESALDVEIANLLDKIETDTTRHARLQADEAGIADKRGIIREALRHRVQALYRVTRFGVLTGSGGFDALVKRFARAKLLQRLVKASLFRMRHLESHDTKLKNETAALAASLEKDRARLAELQQRAKEMQVQNLAQMQESRKFFTVGNPAFTRSESSEFYGLRVVDGDASSGFTALRGKLAFPVVGDFVIRDARRDDSQGQGIEFQTAFGTAVRAAAAGRVGFSDRYGSYGRLVILDHGDNYYTVYGGLDRVEVRVGDDLSRNARIGVVGNESSPPALFFEVRHGTKTLPPRSWLGL
ncbi:MAG: peptidoglycan DD-metalloendopeptidase family protein [Deltaproteobacteria bacterium]|nr:peptidoglycan DD-metalloendopeptidase family protein [Deltaproteobacteria bacterium]